ncbi:MAG: DEAD/DEAH box helicase [Clostridia bacterium]|nr:DEAD/DEAH box helicase [Clostridia bacterium]
MSLDPILTYEKLNESYKEFLDAQFTFRNPKIDKAAKNALSKECELLNGPFIEAHMPYAGENTLEDLVNQKLLNRNIYKAFTKNEYSVYKRYYHQEKAIKYVINKKSIIVASGTGSGKTECFFIPIINELLNEIDNNSLCPGVRALIIYPMNALANDQMARLRASLKNIPEITFGRYIGETPDGNRINISKGRKEIAELYKKEYGELPLNNELLTRAEMENNPPHILITNYAMLEYMLLRANSQKIFNGIYSKYFQYIVLDEAHTYKGAHGTEVAMLIRRLKETIFGKIENCLTCIGTSATLGGGSEEIQKVVEFAKDLFCEDFTSDAIISSKRKPLTEVSGECKKLSYYLNLFEEYKNYNGEDKSSKLYDILQNNKLVYEIRKRVLDKTITISELANSIYKDLNIENNNLESTIAKVIELCGEAISPLDGNPLINAKYHVFARTLEGGFIALKDNPKIFTERRKEYDGYKVFELYNCMKCGQEYISGVITNKDGYDYLEPEEEDSELFMLSNSIEKINIDEDDSEDSKDKSVDLTNENKYLMCPKCGKLFPTTCKESTECCGLNKTKFINLIKIKNKNRSTCYKCGKFNKGTIRKLTTSEDSAIEVLTRKLYQLLPEEKTKKETKKDNNIWGISTNSPSIASGRKLLVFSDNRQEAARFAIFIQNRYNDWLWKKIIYNEIIKSDEEEISFKRLAEKCYKTADNCQLFYDEKTTEEKQDYAKKQLIKEVIELEPRMSLNRLGLIKIKIDNISNINENIINNFIQTFDITKTEFLTIVEFLFDSLRRQGCITFPDGVDQTDDAFEPRNYETYFKKQGGEKLYNKQFFGFIPSNGKTNKRQDFLKKFFNSKGLNDIIANAKASEFLEKFSQSFETDYFTNILPILEKISLKTGIYYKLNLNNITFSKRNTPLYVCEQCGETIHYNLGICGKTNCDGHLIEVTNNEDRGQYYRDSFTKIEMIPMNAKEHTAQISSQTATNYQNLFKDNNINLLSCSTTFEMGVDIGSLESVVLRNVPPETSNYIQRAGRAGRRGSSAAFILTFAKRRSHDLTYYNDPRKMINGIIKAPYIELNNGYLVRRHIHSMIFSYLSKNNIILNKTSDLIKNEMHPDINLLVYSLLSKKPKNLFNSIQRVVPDKIKKELGIDNNWSFVKYLVDNNNPNNNDACLDNAINSFRDMIIDLRQQQQESISTEHFDEASRFKRVISTYEERDYISFLAESNVLPRYGFPVYTVPLELNTDNILKGSLELERDLRMAITEYAPGSQVVANGKYWKPYALKKQSNRGWPTYNFAVCEKCGKKYFYRTAFGVTIPSKDEQCCGKKLLYKQLVIPQFGFTTRRSDKESRKMREETHYYSTLMFNGFLDNKQIETTDFIINGKKIESNYSPNGEMFAINGGSHVRRDKLVGMAFNICEQCGFVNTADIHVKLDSEHKNASGRICTGKMFPAYLGHYFKSDALVLTLPENYSLTYDYESILYAIIEGASKYMEIDRREIGGAIWSNGKSNGINITLFDTVPNGAGHVKRMQPYLKEIFKNALIKVSGICGCGEETCCYGCLRNYDNQLYHDTMSRGAAKRYLHWLLKE